MEFNNKSLNPKFKKSTSKDSVVSFKIREARGTGWLSFNKMKLYLFPPSLFTKLKNLKHLYMSECCLTGSLPLELGHLQSLEVIDVSVNKITSIPDALLPHFPNLKTLDLRCNRLTSLPYTLEYLHNLQELSVAQNQLVALPHSIGKLPSLKILDCSDNMIREIQGEIFMDAMRESLKVLNMDGNLLEKLPRQVGLLVNLEELGVANNELYFLPPTAKRLSRLQVVRHTGNRWSTPLSPRHSPEDLNASFGHEALSKVHTLVYGPE